MKKVLLFVLILFCLAGCGKYDEKDAINDFSDKLDNCKGYKMTGTLKIWRGESSYTYDVESSYKLGDYFKVSLLNKTNNHEQIILKNDSGIFVLTPSLNKSFKFQSEWPYNSSQVYLLQPLLTDINNDSKKKFKKIKNGYVFTTTVEYSNDKTLTKQKIYFDKNMNLTKVEVMDDDDNIQIKFKVTNINFKAKFGKSYFDEDSILDIQNDEDSDEKDSTSTQTTAKLDESLYPMYIPSETYLSSQDKVSTDSGERLILTFSGENPFVLIQETSSDNSSEFVYGDPYMILDTVGAVTDYSVSWNSDGVDYCVVSDTMDIDELISVAESVNSVAVSK